MEDERWFVYIVRCSDETLYTGVTKDLVRRIGEHNSEGGGAKYTRARKPVELAYAEEGESRAAVCRREYQIKRLSAVQKRLLVNNSPLNEKNKSL